MKILTYILISAALLFASCSGDDEDNGYTVNKTDEDYLSDFYSVVIKDSLNNYDSVYEHMIINDNVFKLAFNEGRGEYAEAGDSVAFYYVGSIFSRDNGFGTIFATNIDSIARKANLDTTINYSITRDVVGKGKFIKGVDEGLLNMKKGEFAWIMFPPSKGYGDMYMGVVPAKSSLIFQILLTDIKKN